jgi:hypothetical protein
MGDTGLELASGAQVGRDGPVLLGHGALRSAQVRSNCYQNCYQARAIRDAGDAYCSSRPVAARATAKCAAFSTRKLVAPSPLVHVSRGLITFPDPQLVRCSHPALHREPLVAIPDLLAGLHVMGKLIQDHSTPDGSPGSVLKTQRS